MIAPDFVVRIRQWSPDSLESWGSLVNSADKMTQDAGKSDKYQMACSELQELIQKAQFEALLRLLDKRLYVRALTTMWLELDEIAMNGLRSEVLNKLVKQERLSRLTLLNLSHLYFMKYDLLPGGKLVLSLLGAVLRKNLAQQRLRTSSTSRVDIIGHLMENEELLLHAEAPRLITDKAIAQSIELQFLFQQLGVGSFISGRFGQICQTRYYIETLKKIPLGDKHHVLEELLKPDVHNVIYADELTMGHAALQVLIDRCSEPPSENWQEFILAIAGDPRIRSGAHSYRKWWMPLGTERIDKVQSWLSKEDLKLFLRAVEEYGRETNNYDLNRMFPARKAFLEGLFELDLVRRTRLMLGRKAQDNVKRILSGEMKTTFAWLGNELSDKAIIYLDCGDFHIIEGSHSFKIWVYFGLPHPEIISYDRESFSAYELRSKFPIYHDRNNSRLCAGFTHTPDRWQYAVLAFLKRNGIHLDEDVLLSSRSLRVKNAGHYARNTRSIEQPRLPTPSRWQTNEKVDSEVTKFSDIQKRLRELRKPRMQEYVSKDSSRDVNKTSAPSKRPSEPTQKNLPVLNPQETRVLKYIAENPSERARYIANAVGASSREVNMILYGRLSTYFKSNDNFEWSLTDAGEEHYISL